MSIERGRCFRASEHTHMVYSMREHEAVVREGIKGIGVCNRRTTRIARKESIERARCIRTWGSSSYTREMHDDIWVCLLEPPTHWTLEMLKDLNHISKGIGCRRLMKMLDAVDAQERRM
ncbi:hypothetical protein BHE74_00011539 [Ensete ventricosum]|nr:hypothetical protein BHE74_00011539 [Ensete ventricosum]